MDAPAPRINMTVEIAAQIGVTGQTGDHLDGHGQDDSKRIDPGSVFRLSRQTHFNATIFKRRLVMSVWQTFEVSDGGAFPLHLDRSWGAFPPNTYQRALITLTQNSFLQRGKLRTRMCDLIMSPSGPLDIEFRGCRYRVEPRRNLIDRGILVRPKYNASEIAFLQEAVRGGGVALDIGSNVGLYALPLAKAAGPDGRVLAIDPNPEMIDHLSFNARASGLQNVDALNVAVGDREALVDLQIRRQDASLVRTRENPTGATEMRPLVTIAKEMDLERIDAIKIDIEGGEDAAMVPFLQNAEPHLLPKRIVIERASKTHDYPGCVAEFERLGFRLVGRTRNNFMYERQPKK